MKLFTSFVIMLALSALSCNKKHPDSIRSAENQDEDMASVNNDTELKNDYDFAVEAADGNLLEVQLGELALEKGYSQEVKKFGKLMMADHNQSAIELHKIAHQKNVVLPNSLSDKSRKKYDEINAKEGATFDKAYMRLMVDHHASTLDAFQKESEKGKDPDFKNFAASKMSSLREHSAQSKAGFDLIK